MVLPSLIVLLVDLGGVLMLPGASGNVATDDLVYLLDELGVETDIDEEKSIESSHSLLK